MGYWLCDAGDRLFRQINRVYPKRDRASDGWVGTGGDHLPCASCQGDRRGVVRAVDIDSSFSGRAGYNTTEIAWQVANQLRQAMLDGDGRVDYIIAWNPEKRRDFICSTNPAYQPLGVWRDYDGDSHVNHIHVSFTPEGDFHDRPFDLPVLHADDRERRRLRRLVQRLRDGGHKGSRRVRRLLRKLRNLRR